MVQPTQAMKQPKLKEGMAKCGECRTPMYKWAWRCYECGVWNARALLAAGAVVVGTGVALILLGHFFGLLHWFKM